MALRRVRSRAHGYTSIVSDEWLTAWPDDFDVIDDEPDIAHDTVPAPSVADPSQDLDDGRYRGDYR